MGNNNIQHVNSDRIEIAIGNLSRTKETRALAAAKEAFPHWANSMLTATRIPALYDTYGIGTTGDVTILVWLNGDDAIAKAVCW